MAKVRRQTSGIKFILPIRCNNSSSVTLRVPPSAPVSATPTAFAPQIGQFPCLGDADTHAPHMCPFPTGEGWRKSLLSSAHSPYPRPPCIYSGRADQACTNLLGSLARYVRTRGMTEDVENGKTTDFRFAIYRTHLPRTACATNSCTREEIYKREESPLI